MLTALYLSQRAPIPCGFHHLAHRRRFHHRLAPRHELLVDGPPSFEPFREASRKGAFLSSQRLTPRIHQSRASRLALPVTPTAEKKRREKPAHHRSSFLFFTPAFSDPFQRGKGRSMVCGGWHLKAGVVAKMVKWWWCCWVIVAWLAVVVVGVVVCCNGGQDMSVQNNDSNRKTYLKGSQPG